ncbi:MAG: carbohydrate binding domain-containing protein [Patescibacteria group bacterium]
MSTIARRTGFTIVELLIVIVIIAVLAAITIVAFNGIQQRARTSQVVSSTSQTKKKLEVYKIENGSYPTTGNLASSGITDSSVTYQYVSNGTTFCATGTSGNVSYKVSDTTNPELGGCAGHGQGGVAAITNMIPNPSFESNRTFWNWADGSGYTGAVTSSIANRGTSSFVINSGTTVADRYLETYIDGVSPGTYSFSAYVYLTGAGATNGDRQAWFHCAVGSCAASPEMSYNKSLLNQWQRLQKVLTVNATSNLRIRFYGPDGSATYFDGIMVTAGSSIPSYADGNTTNWAWNGTVNNSTSSGPAS